MQFWRERGNFRNGSKIQKKKLEKIEKIEKIEILRGLKFNLFFYNFC